MSLAKTYTLPPDFSSKTTKTYGIFHIKIGNLFWFNINQTLANSVIKLKFWGESHDGVLLRPRNSTQNYPYEMKYDIKVGLQNFSNYLEDMSKIKLILFEKKSRTQIGHVLINLLIYLKRE